MNILQHLAALVLTAAMSFGLVAPSQPQSFGAALPQQDALVDTFLASGIDENDLSMTLADGTTRDGETLMGYYCFTVDNNTTQLEYICGTASSTSVTSLERGVKVSNPTATSSALAFRHRRFASVQVTDFPFNQLAQRLLNGTDGFESPLKYDGVSTSTLGADGDNLANVQYVNDATFDGAGVVQASETSSGFVELATGAEAAATTLSGSVARLALPTAISTSTAPASGNYIPTSESDGNIAQGWLDLTESFSFTGGVTANTVTIGDNGAHGDTKQIAIGETFTGATSPQPAYASTTDGKLYVADGNDLQKLKFAGFVTSSGAANDLETFQASGIVDGFSGLATGTPYYLSDTVGTISSTVGTYQVQVGIAVSATELLIQKGRRYASGTTSFSSTATLVVTTGFRPSRVMVFATLRENAGDIAMSNGGWNVFGGNDSVYVATDGDVTSAEGIDTSNAWSLNRDDGADLETGVVTTVTDTGFTLSNTHNTGSAAASLYWTAEGDF